MQQAGPPINGVVAITTGVIVVSTARGDERVGAVVAEGAVVALAGGNSIDVGEAEDGVGAVGTVDGISATTPFNGVVAAVGVDVVVPAPGRDVIGVASSLYVVAAAGAGERRCQRDPAREHQERQHSYQHANHAILRPFHRSALLTPMVPLR